MNQSYQHPLFSQKNEQQITDAYSEPHQISKMKSLTKKLAAFSHRLFLQNTTSQMFDKVLNIPLDELSCSAVVLRGIHKKVDICQTDHSIHSKQRIFSYSLVIYGSIQANERLTKVFVVFVLSVISFAPMSQTIGVIDRSSAWYSLHISNLWCVCWSVCM